MVLWNICHSSLHRRPNGRRESRIASGAKMAISWRVTLKMDTIGEIPASLSHLLRRQLGSHSESVTHFLAKNHFELSESILLLLIAIFPKGRLRSQLNSASQSQPLAWWICFGLFGRQIRQPGPGSTSFNRYLSQSMATMSLSTLARAYPRRCPPVMF